MDGRLSQWVRLGVWGMVAVGVVLLGAACGAPPESADTMPAEEAASMSASTTEEVLKRHQATFGAGDVEGVLADYAPNAVVFTPNGIVRGTDELRAMFEGLFAEWGQPGTTFEMRQELVDGNHAYMFWDAETADNVYEAGQDAFVVLNGQIVAHFFSAKITSKAASTE
jgi:ketosteroid isomerase-like protein